MESRFLVMTATGATPPKYIHRTLYRAQNEAIRLSKQYNTFAYILEVVGIVQLEEVPVTELKPVVKMYKNHDDLPF